MNCNIVLTRTVGFYKQALESNKRINKKFINESQEYLILDKCIEIALTLEQQIHNFELQDVILELFECIEKNLQLKDIHRVFSDQNLVRLIPTSNDVHAKLMELKIRIIASKFNTNKSDTLLTNKIHLMNFLNQQKCKKVSIQTIKVLGSVKDLHNIIALNLSEIRAQIERLSDIIFKKENTKFHDELCSVILNLAQQDKNNFDIFDQILSNNINSSFEMTVSGIKLALKIYQKRMKLKNRSLKFSKIKRVLDKYIQIISKEKSEEIEKLFKTSFEPLFLFEIIPKQYPELMDFIQVLSHQDLKLLYKRIAQEINEEKDLRFENELILYLKFFILNFIHLQNCTDIENIYNLNNELLNLKDFSYFALLNFRLHFLFCIDQDSLLEQIKIEELERYWSQSFFEAKNPAIRFTISVFIIFASIRKQPRKQMRINSCQDNLGFYFQKSSIPGYVEISLQPFTHSKEDVFPELKEQRMKQKINFLKAIEIITKNSTKMLQKSGEVDQINTLKEDAEEACQRQIRKYSERKTGLSENHLVLIIPSIDEKVQTDEIITMEQQFRESIQNDKDDEFYKDLIRKLDLLNHPQKAIALLNLFLRILDEKSKEYYFIDSLVRWYIEILQTTSMDIEILFAFCFFKGLEDNLNSFNRSIAIKYLKRLVIQFELKSSSFVEQPSQHFIFFLEDQFYKLKYGRNSPAHKEFLHKLGRFILSNLNMFSDMSTQRQILRFQNIFSNKESTKYFKEIQGEFLYDGFQIIFQLFESEKHLQSNIILEFIRKGYSNSFQFVQILQQECQLLRCFVITSTAELEQVKYFKALLKMLSDYKANIHINYIIADLIKRFVQSMQSPFSILSASLKSLLKLIDKVQAFSMKQLFYLLQKEVRDLPLFKFECEQDANNIDFSIYKSHLLLQFTLGSLLVVIVSRLEKTQREKFEKYFSNIENCIHSLKTDNGGMQNMLRYKANKLYNLPNSIFILYKVECVCYLDTNLFHLDKVEMLVKSLLNLYKQPESAFVRNLSAECIYLLSKANFYAVNENLDYFWNSLKMSENYKFRKTWIDDLLPKGAQHTFRIVQVIQYKATNMKRNLVEQKPETYEKIKQRCKMELNIIAMNREFNTCKLKMIQSNIRTYGFQMEKNKEFLKSFTCAQLSQIDKETLEEINSAWSTEQEAVKMIDKLIEKENNKKQ